MEENIAYYLEVLSYVPIFWLIFTAFGMTLIENIFPPAPSDVALVAVAIIVGNKGASIIPIIVASTIGSTIGFWIMFVLGSKFEHKIIETNKIKFISKTAIDKVEEKFRRWGFKLIAINRFMSGTRAVVSFFAGMSDLSKTKSIAYAGISSFLYYGILSLAGYYFGYDWRTLMEYFHLYEKIVITAVIVIIVVAVVIWVIRKCILNSNNVKEVE
jgi:membrane protein DedA with SNARE-associated domain